MLDSASISPTPSLIPQTKTLKLSEHRTYKLRDGKIALLSSEHTGWIIIKEGDYSKLTEWLSKPTTFADASPYEGATIEALWEAGLIDTVDRSNTTRVVKSRAGVTLLLLKVTGSCNFQCTYCYDYDVDRFKTQLSFERATRVISDILEKQDVLKIAFHGGEPLLRFDFIQKIVDFIEKTFTEKKRISYTIQTNGTRFSDGVINFLNEKNFSVGISVDGNSRSSNRLRIGPRGTTSFDVLQKLLGEFGDFARERCGILAVVSASSIKEIPEFAMWLQSEGFRSLSLAFMDATGKGVGLNHEVPSAQDAILLYKKLVDLVRKGEISDINISSLVSYIDNFFSFVPRDFCNRGPCAAATEFLVLDSENALRSCDIVYDPFFEIGSATQNPNDLLVKAGRNKITERHIWLKSSGNSCSTCSLFGLCGGTCAGKAISATGSANTIDGVTCNIAKYIYPEILQEISEIGLSSSPLISYYRRHHLGTQ